MVFLKKQDWIGIIVESEINLIQKIFLVGIITNLLSVYYIEFSQILIIIFFVNLYLYNQILQTE